jgi:3-hydroxyisobutyrate dehydrogenase-like beta-hydroxyacid dehydrogenase
VKAAFIGLGRMGGNMARRIAQAGLPLGVYNRNPQKCQPLAAFGAAVHTSADEAVENSGVAPEKFYDLMSSTLFTVGFAASLGAKDMGLVRDAAKLARTPMPLASLLEDRFLRALAQGLGEKDWSVIGQLQREDAGL